MYYRGSIKPKKGQKALKDLHPNTPSFGSMPGHAMEYGLVELPRSI